MNNDRKTLHHAALAARPWYQLTAEEAFAWLDSTPAGLSREEEVQTRLAQHGPNTLPQKKPQPAWRCFLAHFNGMLIYILLAVAVITALMGHWVDTFVILGVAVINAFIGFIPESNAEKSLQGIQNMLSNEALALRDGDGAGGGAGGRGYGHTVVWQSHSGRFASL
nr:carbonate dehydratase [Candidatus Pantoea persica]